jgi:hypothetical protein
MSSHELTVAVYLVIGCSLVGLEAAGRRPNAMVPTFAALVTWAARHRSAQFGMLLVWWWLGWHFVLGV